MKVTNCIKYMLMLTIDMDAFNFILVSLIRLISIVLIGVVNFNSIHSIGSASQTIMTTELSIACMRLIVKSA